jgi:hypothetical protein
LINNSNGQNQAVYYVSLVPNQTYYAITLTTTPVPTKLPDGWSLPDSPGWALPVAATTPQIIIQNNAFKQIIGFNYGTYPAATQATIYQKNSDFTPVVSPVSTVNVLCNLVNNEMSTSYPNVVFSFAPSNVSFGGYYHYQSPYPIYQPITDGQYKNIDAQLYGDDNKPLPMRDKSGFIVIYNIRDAK